jgi:hypothetical protein
MGINPSERSIHLVTKITFLELTKTPDEMYWHPKGFYAGRQGLNLSTKSDAIFTKVSDYIIELTISCQVTLKHFRSTAKKARN